jgi:hypothetical protein
MVPPRQTTALVASDRLNTYDWGRSVHPSEFRDESLCFNRYPSHTITRVSVLI